MGIWIQNLQRFKSTLNSVNTISIELRNDSRVLMRNIKKKHNFFGEKQYTEMIWVWKTQ